MYKILLTIHPISSPIISPSILLLLLVFPQSPDVSPEISKVSSDVLWLQNNSLILDVLSHQSLQTDCLCPAYELPGKFRVQTGYKNIHIFFIYTNRLFTCGSLLTTYLLMISACLISYLNCTYICYLLMLSASLLTKYLHCYIYYILALFCHT